MTCERTTELLPWLLNGTLGEEEKRQILAHLETCDVCREELRQTRLAWSLIEGHLPAETLVDYALGRPLGRAHRELVESHVAACSRCRGELALLRQDPEPAVAELPERRSPATPGPRARRDSGSMVRPWALAATLAALIAGAGWLWSAQRLAVERATWRQQESELRARVEALSGARLNTPVVELLPSTTAAVLREAPESEPAVVNEVEPFGDAREVVLILLGAGSGCGGGCTVEMLDEGGERLWGGAGLVPSPAGDLTLILPGHLLPPGKLTIEVRDGTAGGAGVRYLFTVGEFESSSE